MAKFPCGQTLLLAMVILARLAVSQMSPVSELGEWSRKRIELVNNGYSGVLVAIGAEVPYNETLIQNIKSVLTRASAFMYNATNHRAYMSQIYILVPDTWPDYNHSSLQATASPGAMTVHNASHWATQTTANIEIRSTGEDGGSNPPFVRQPGPCGDPGEYMHLPVDLFSTDGSQNQWGDPATVFVHEWGHLRWGLFDEYPSTADPHFYVSSTGVVEGTRCSAAIAGDIVSSLEDIGDTAVASSSCRVPEGELPPSHCYFRPHSNTNQTASGSVMYNTMIPSIKGFCHSDPIGDSSALHVSEAPTKHNRQCGGQSAWDVMLKSRDFHNATNPPQSVGFDTTPTFNLIRRRRRTVFVIDLSLSMGDWDNILYICERFINESSADSQVGIVHYYNYRTSFIPMMDMDAAGKADLRNQLRSLNNIPTRYATHPWKPLNSAYLKIFGGVDENAMGADLYYFTKWQWQDSYSSVLIDKIELLTAIGVTLWSVEFSPHNVTNGLLTSELTSKYFKPIELYTRDSPLTEYSAMIDPRGYPVPSWEEDGLLQVFRSSFELSPRKNASRQVLIDRSIGNRTAFCFAWTQELAPEVILRSPTGVFYNLTSPNVSIVNLEKKEAVIRVPGVAQNGTWQVNLRTLENATQSVNVWVFSAMSDSSRPPIQVRPLFVDQELYATSDMKLILYGEVKRGEVPVAGATVSVTVTGPDNDTVDVELRDSGFGADVRAGDGIYSAHFVQFKTNGSYRFNMNVRGDGWMRSRRHARTVGGNGQNHDWEIPAEAENVERFMRTSPEVSIQVSGEVAKLLANDTFPPARISNLQVLDSDPSLLTVKLRWTAMGDDYDVGNASRYHIRISNESASLARSFEAGVELLNDAVIDGDLSSPKPSFQTETFTIQMPSKYCNPMCAIRLRAVDDQGNEGDPSNLVMVSFPSKSPAATRESTTERYNETDDGDPVDRGQNRRRFIASAVSMSIMGVLIAVGAIVGYTIMKRVDCSTNFTVFHRSDTDLERNRDVRYVKKGRAMRKKITDALVIEDFDISDCHIITY